MAIYGTRCYTLQSACIYLFVYFFYFFYLFYLFYLLFILFLISIFSCAYSNVNDPNENIFIVVDWIFSLIFTIEIIITVTTLA